MGLNSADFQKSVPHFSLLYLMNVNDRNEKDSELSPSFTDAKKNLIYQKSHLFSLFREFIQ